MTEDSITNEISTEKPDSDNVDLWLEFQKLKQNLIGYPLMISIAAFNLWGVALDSGTHPLRVWFWGFFAVAGLLASFFESRKRVKRIEKAVTERLNLSPARVS